MPSLGGLLDWIKKEGLNAIWIILIVFCIRYLAKSEWAKAISLGIMAGVAAFVVNKPEVVSQALEKVASLLIPGG